ncbi:MAG: hypothetical protein N2509_08275 [Treponemataceae bacterium]|nr:hypothetical protein [Treponemataceae bacterium]
MAEWPKEGAPFCVLASEAVGPGGFLDEILVPWYLGGGAGRGSGPGTGCRASGENEKNKQEEKPKESFAHSSSLLSREEIIPLPLWFFSSRPRTEDRN